MVNNVKEVVRTIRRSAEADSRDGSVSALRSSVRDGRTRILSDLADRGQSIVTTNDGRRYLIERTTDR
jgi:hypothetical protein